MGPLRPARPKRKKAAATTAPDKGATTTKALPLALLLLLLPTGAKCAHRNQTTCGHTSPQPPRFGVVKRLTASKTILETYQPNSPAHEPAKPAMPLEFRKQSMHLTPAQLNGNFANHWHLTTSPHSTNAHTVEQLDANFHDEPFTYTKRHTPCNHSADHWLRENTVDLNASSANTNHTWKGSPSDNVSPTHELQSSLTCFPATHLPLQRQKENDKKENRTSDHLADRLGAANECRMPRTATGRPAFLPANGIYKHPLLKKLLLLLALFCTCAPLARRAARSQTEASIILHRLPKGGRCCCKSC